MSSSEQSHPAPAALATATPVFIVPQRRITLPQHVALFKQAPAYKSLVAFIQAVNESVRSRATADPYETNETIARVVAMLDTMDLWITDIPPVPQQGRYGNASFRVWHERLTQNSHRLAQETLPAEFSDASKEIATYLNEAFGNAVRIDYGSGHELAFVAFLCCLSLLRLIPEKCFAAVALQAFNRYLRLVRRLQKVYSLEPAGSHGVWGLDDFQFLPYVWGASQLVGHPRLQPDMIGKLDIAEANADDFLFFDAVKFIFQMKTGPFHEHSRYLYDISGVPEWSKVNSGLIKMFKEEVLHKFPVIQHFLFGSLLEMGMLAGAHAPAPYAGLDVMTSLHPSAWKQGAVPHAGPLPPAGGAGMPPTAFPRGPQAGLPYQPMSFPGAGGPYAPQTSFPRPAPK